MELQETLLIFIMDIDLAQGIKTMMHAVAIVHRPTKVPGGIILATIQTSMVSTMVEHNCLMLMVYIGVHGRDTTTPSNSLR